MADSGNEKLILNVTIYGMSLSAFTYLQWREASFGTIEKAGAPLPNNVPSRANSS